MRLSVVLHYSGLLLAGVGLAMLLPFAFSLYYEESDRVPFAISIGITLMTAAQLYFWTPAGKGVGVNISRREALLLVSISWIMASVFGSLPYLFDGTFSNYLDCLFESVSGFTTTGASVLTAIEDQPHGILMWRNFTQWLGGMGIVVLFVSLFPLLGVGTAYLFEAESPGPEVQRLRAHITYTSRMIWGLYIGFTAFEVALLYGVGDMSFFDSLAHAFGTMSTGGFSTRDISIGAYDSLSINIIIISFMFLAGINFALYYGLLWRRSLRTFWESTEFRLYAMIVLGACVLIGTDLVMNADHSVAKAAEAAAFNTVSVQTTTGFAISDFGGWPAFSQAALLVLMILGASAGSTGGALKVIRLAVLFKYAYRQILLAFNPRVISPVRLGGRALSEKVVNRVVGFTIIYFGIIIVGTLIVSFTDELDLTSALSAVIASVGNIGPGLGLVGPAENYAFMSSAGKITLMTCMLVGRLELLTVFVLFAPTFWRWR